MTGRKKQYEVAEIEPVKPRRKFKKTIRRVKADKVKPLANPALIAIADQGSTEIGKYAANKVSYRKFNATIAAMIREIGNEPVEGSPGWTRIEAVIRSTFIDAMSGNNGARELLLERGWGKVPTPVEVDIRNSFLTVSRDMGLTRDDIESDPVLATLAQQNGVVIENLPVVKMGVENEKSKT